jgi:2-methylfumaryl-CoA isomerase
VRATAIEGEITALGTRLGLDLRDEGDRFRARHAIAALLVPWFASRTLAEVREALDAARVTWGAYRTLREALTHDPDLSTANPMLARIEQPGIGSLLAAGSPVDFGAFPQHAASPAPRLGEHTHEILAGILGLSDGEIGRLHDARVVASARA